MATDTGFGMVRFFDDFLTDTVDADDWNVAGSGSGTAFIIATAVNGTITGQVTNNSSSDLSVMYTSLIWQANQYGPLIMEARIKCVTSDDLMLFVGLSDEATTENPMLIAAGTVTTAATDAAGFYWAGGETTPVWRCGGVKNGTDSTQTAASSVYNPTVGTYQTLRVVLNADGSGNFSIDGNTIVENVASCVTVSTALMPYIAVADDGAAGYGTVDYVYVSSGRT